METSLRLKGDSKSLRIHAKEKVPIGYNFLLQGHGEIDMSTGSPSYFAMVMRRFFPGLSAKVGAGIQMERGNELEYKFKGLKSIPISSDGLFGINLKGLFLTDQEFNEKNKLCAAELSWSIFNFKKDQDVRLKLGYEIIEKMPYFQMRENNWTLNAYMNGKWDLRFDL